MLWLLVSPLCGVDVPEKPSNDRFEMGEVWVPLVEVFSHLSFEEFLMVLAALCPLWLGLFATLRVLTGARQSPDFDTDGEGATHADVEKGAEAAMMHIDKVEQQVSGLQRAQDARFSDLHKDLAGIVWELSKLRADMARWQALAQLGSRTACKGSANTTEGAS